MMRMAQSPGGAQASDSGQFYANLWGYNYVPYDFTNGDRIITEGHFPESDNECIISKNLLENSGLKIGDSITLNSTLRDKENESATVDISFTLKIVGYYDDMTSEYANDFMQNAYFNRRNEILTTVDTIISHMQEGYDGIRLDGTFYLQNPDMLDTFATELYSKGLSNVWDVTISEVKYPAIYNRIK